MTSLWLLAGALSATAGQAPPAESRDSALRQLEQRMLGLVNKDRLEHGKTALVHDARLAAVARSHSRDMMDNAFFAHHSKRTGTVGDRLWAARVPVKLCGENIARNADIARAQQQLMQSPGHRKNILGPLYTHGGVGMVQAKSGQYFITQVFAVPAPVIDGKTLQADVLAKLNKTRLARGKLPFRATAVLNRLAAEQAARLADAGKGMRIDLGALAEAAGLKHKELRMAHLLTWTPLDLARAEVLLKPRLGHIGLGFARNTKHRRLGYGIFWAVVMFAND